jgi:hypothetical protein
MTVLDIATYSVIISAVLGLLLMPAAKQTHIEINTCIGYCPAAK